jgi:hypothetical protein
MSVLARGAGMVFLDGYQNLEGRPEILMCWVGLRSHWENQMIYMD